MTFLRLRYERTVLHLAERILNTRGVLYVGRDPQSGLWMTVTDRGYHGANMQTVADAVQCLPLQKDQA